MIPNENIWATDFTALNGIGKLVSVPSICKKQKMVEWHVEVSEVRVASEMKVVVSNSIEAPDQSKVVLAENAIRFQQQTS